MDNAPPLVGEAGSVFSLTGHDMAREHQMSPQQRAMGRLFDKPHTLTFMWIIIGIFYVFGVLGGSGSGSASSGINRGLAAIVLVVLAFAFLHFRDGPFTRPHPGLWRIVLGVNLIYLTALVFLLFQTQEQARMLFTTWWPDVGVPLVPGNWAENCELTVENIKSVLDRFVFAHFFGWMLKALLLRDVVVLLHNSVLWELMEITLQWALPNFAECWWDQWILDVLLCNLGGICFGMFLCRLWQAKIHHFSGRFEVVESPNKKPAKKAKRFSLELALNHTIMPLLPVPYIDFDWAMFSSPMRFMQMLMICWVLLLVDLNGFLLKQVLYLPNDNPLNPARLILWFFIGAPAIREYYKFVSDDSCVRLGAHAWMCIFTILTEVLLWLKCSPGVYEGKRPPPGVVISWIVWGVVWLGWFCWYFYWRKRKTE